MNSRELFSLSGRRILVTGAAGHVGRELCRYLVDDGAMVLATDIDENGLEALKLELDPSGQALVTFTCDLSDEDQRVSFAQAVSSGVSALDGVVFAAAFVGTSDLEGWNVRFSRQSLSTWRKAIELNLTAPFHLCQLLEPVIRQGSNPSIVNVGSIYGSIAPDWSLYEGLAMSNPAAYAVSKGGLLQLTRWLAATLAPEIRVNIVQPGGIARDQESQFVSRYVAKVPAGRMATEDDIIGAVVYLLGRSAIYVTGENLVVAGGLSA